MKLGQPIKWSFDKRYYQLNRPAAIHDVFDAIVELLTNSDDSYHRLYERQKRNRDGGDILIETCERRGKPSILVIRDKAEGMTLQTMCDKFTNVGKKSSESGDRGFMSRGLRDCTELGTIVIDSIFDDRHFQCKLTPQTDLIPLVNGNRVTDELRRSLHIEKGNGTVVMIEVERHSLPRIEKIVRDLPWHYALKDLLDEDSPAEVLIKDYSKKEKPQKIVHRAPEGQILIKKECYPVAGYPEAQAYFTLVRSPIPLEDISERFRKSGFIIKGRRAIHECSLLYPSFEKDPHAKHYFGRIECPYIDLLMEDFDGRREKGLQPTIENPCFVIDASRQHGLNRSHPFTKVLLDYPTQKLKEFVEQDRQASRKDAEQIENAETKAKLKELAKAASKFLQEQVEELDEISQEESIDDRAFAQKGVLIFPTYANIAVEEVRPFALYVNRNVFDKEGAEVSIRSDSEAVEIIDPLIRLLPHRKRKNMLYARFRANGVSVKEGVCIETKCEGLPKGEALFNVVETKFEERDFVNPLEFEHKQYRVREGSSKLVRLYAKCPEIVTTETEVKVESSDPLNLPIRGRCILTPIESSNFALAEIRIEARRLRHEKIEIMARLNGITANTHVKIVQEDDKGIPLTFQLSDDDFGNFRAIWADHEKKPNTLLISAKNESIKRYLGPGPAFEGQNSAHFRAIVAEIVAEAVCRRSLRLEAEKHGWQFRLADLKEDSLIIDTVFAELQKRMKAFLPVAHSIMLSEAEVKELQSSLSASEL